MLPKGRLPQDHPWRTWRRTWCGLGHPQNASKLRKKVEMLFANLQRILGLVRLRLRGPCGANDEFLLAATAQLARW